MIFKGNTSRRKRIFRISVLGLIFLLIFLIGDFTISTYYSSRKKIRADINYYSNVIAKDKLIALTFDDGPDPVKTREIMEILQSEGVPATFFFMGSHAWKYPEIVKEAYDAGFEIGNHTFSHSEEIFSSKERLEKELNSTNKIISDITGHQTYLFRPPYLLEIGSDATMDNNEINAVSQRIKWVSELGYVTVGADIDSYDWQAKSADEIIANFNSMLANGGHIALLHDSTLETHTIEALPALIKQLRDNGYDFVTVSEILGLNFVRNAKFEKDLTLGVTDAETNGEVTQLQVFLQKEGEYLYPPNGNFDNSTFSALKEWQDNNKIRGETGFLGPLTRDAILKNLDVSIPDEIKSSEFKNNFTRIVCGASKYSIIVAASVAAVTDKVILVCLFFVGFRLLFVLFLKLRSSYIRQFKKREIKSFNPGVSVLIPVYNEEENVAQTIESVLACEYSPLEIVVIDDGSSDRTSLVVESFVRRFPETIRLIRKENGGKASALNLGIKSAKFEIFVAMDGDTLFDKDVITNLVKHFSDENVGAVAGKVCAAESGNIINLFQDLEYVVAQNMDKQAMSTINAVAVIPGPIGAWRRELVLGLGSYSKDTLVEDQDLTLAILSSGKKIIYENKAIAYTETPFTIGDFVKQRFRWVFGGVQCLWKYKKNFFNLQKPSLGFVVLPNNFIFNVILPLLYPVSDVVFFGSLFLGLWQKVIYMYLLLTAIDLFYAIIGFIGEKRKFKLLVLLPVQRIFYRFVICFVVIKSIIKAIEGTEALWNKVSKVGFDTAGSEPMQVAINQQ